MGACTSRGSLIISTDPTSIQCNMSGLWIKYYRCLLLLVSQSYQYFRICGTHHLKEYLRNLDFNIFEFVSTETTLRLTNLLEIFSQNFKTLASVKLTIWRYNDLLASYFAKHLYLNELNSPFYRTMNILGVVFITRWIKSRNQAFKWWVPQILKYWYDWETSKRRQR